MTDDEIIDRLLKDLYSVQKEVNVAGYLNNLQIRDKKEASRIMGLMKAYCLAQPTKLFNIVISDLGVKISQNGGWFKHLESIENKEKHQLEKEKLEITLAESNIEANRINKINSNRNLIFSIINIILAIGNIVLLAWQLSKAVK